MEQRVYARTRRSCGSICDDDEIVQQPETIAQNTKKTNKRSRNQKRKMRIT